MFRATRIAAAITIVICMISCAGRNFVRPEPDSLTLGKTTYQRIIDQFGKPYKEGSKLKNDKAIKTITYAYSSAGGNALNEGVTPARAMSFHFADDLLVGYEFVSSFKEDHSDFDDSKIGSIRKGETTQEQIIELLGEPKGKYIFPLIKNREAKAMVYMYSQFKNYVTFHKLLIISIENNIVSDVEYTTSGKM